MSLIEEIADLLEEMHGKPEWGPTLSLLDELVLTILSQNTSAANYRRSYDRLKERFPNYESMIQSPISEIASAIKCGGLADMKAPRIQAILRKICEERGELSLEFLRKTDPWEAFRYLVGLPGVGPKTAACVLMFGLGWPIFPVDTHIHRISQRLGLIPVGTTAERTQELLQVQIPECRIYSLHVNLVTHGRRICKAQSTDCDRCLLFMCPSRGLFQKSARYGGSDGIS